MHMHAECILFYQHPEAGTYKGRPPADHARRQASRYELRADQNRRVNSPSRLHPMYQVPCAIAGRRSAASCSGYSRTSVTRS